MTDLSGLRQVLGAEQQRLIDLVLDALSSGGARQHTRLLRLHTPLGADTLMAEQAHIDEHIGPGHSADLLGGHAEVIALSLSAHLQPTDLLGQPVLLELLTAHSRTELRPFHGHVTQFELLGSDGGLARYRLVIEPWTAFMRHRVDAWSYQGQSVQGVVDQLVADYQGQGTLNPQVRWELADASQYTTLSLYSQHDETDLAFLQRTLQFHGLFCWFEHESRLEDASLGHHTLVIADHAGALKANAQGRMRFTQAHTVLPEDSITRWKATRRVGVSTLAHASWDYRDVSAHSAHTQTVAHHEQAMALHHVDQPGTYAFESPQQAALAANRQLQAFDALRERFEAQGTVRTLAPATRFSLVDHPRHSGDEFVVLSVQHRARNNLHADAKAGLQHLLGQVPASLAEALEAPLYEARFTAQPVSLPVRPAPQALNHHPALGGLQTALVVGLQDPLHTDRDGRIKVQLHWQRGAQASHRLGHPTAASEADNAPGNDAAGTWVRVSQAWAGANWGGVFQPRLGQEVLVAFVEGDIDRPVVVGAAYNGQGTPEAQGNQVGHGSVNATGNAPAWFPGEQRQGSLEGHAHSSTLSGFKSQSLESSQSGGGGHNQLVFDDTPGEGRLLAHTTQHQTWLQLGHLLQQHDNQRLAHRGHGLELHTQAQGAVRAAQGLHLSTHARPQGTSSTRGQPTDTREAHSQLSAHADLVKAFSENAQAHHARLPQEPAAAQLPAQQALQATLSSLAATEGQEGPSHAAPESANSASAFLGIDGGHGRIPVTGRPDLVLNAAGDIASLTPQHTLLSTGGHTTVTTGHDTNLLAQRHQAWAVKGGISLFTRGEAKNPQRAVQDVGIKLHAASGNVRTEAQSGPFTLTAQQGIDLQSTAAHIEITAPNRIVLNGGGGYVKIEGGNIEIGTSGKASFKAAMKELTGGGSASGQAPKMHDARALFDERFQVTDSQSGQPLAFYRYRVESGSGEVLASGFTDANGYTTRVHSSKGQTLRVIADNN